MQIFLPVCFSKNMLLSVVDNNFLSGYNPQFCSRKLPIDLNYVIEQRAKYLPERMLGRIKQVIDSRPDRLPTLKELHKDTYSPLNNCQTLEEAKELFPEFAGLSEANVSFKRNTGNIKILKDNNYLKEGFSLKLLKDIWVDLKTQDEIAGMLGLEGRHSLGWILKKIGFVNYSQNYRTLLLSSDEETRKIIAEKTRKWNQTHYDEMLKRNKHAAQFNKSEKYRAEQSQRMKEMFIREPERRERISKNSTTLWSNPENRRRHSKIAKEYCKNHPEKAQKSSMLALEAWKSAPELSKLMSDFFKEYTANDKVLAARLRNIICKLKSKTALTEYDKMLIKKCNKAFYEAHPEAKTMLSDAYKRVQKDLKK